MPGRLLGFDLGKASSLAGNRASIAVGELSTSPPRSTMDHLHLKRPNIARNKHSSEKKDKHPAVSTAKHVAFELITESPPALLLDEPDKSTGALYSLTLRMTVADTPITLNSVTLALQAVSINKKPVAEKCPDCLRQVSVVKDWKLVQGKATFQPGKHEFPVSHLIPGHLPATTRGHLSSIEYEFVAKAQSESNEVFELKKPLEVQRAIRPGGERNSVRIFPPTNLNLNVTFPSVIHPLGDFNVCAKMTGLNSLDGESQTRWRLRKVDWRVEEHETSISPACSKHAAKVGGEGKGVQHEQQRIIGQAELKNGWKTDLEAGEVEGELVCSLDRNRKPNNDVSSPSGLKINHILIIEMIIAEEWVPKGKPKNATPTGVARVLRTQFNVVVTERAGMGIAWDDEMPPLYEDVPASPPKYLNVEPYDGDELNEDVDSLHLGN